MSTVERLVPPHLRSGLRELVESKIAAALLPEGVRTRLFPHAFQVTSATWNHDYETGRWDYLTSLQEMPRYAMIAGYCASLRHPFTVLDVGCGSGILPRKLRPLRYTAYLGVDLSDAAVAQARSQACHDTEFQVADAETYTPDRPFDVIVLNELLYYLNEPEKLFDRCAASLGEEGGFVVSLWDCAEARRTWMRCVDRVEILDEVVVRRSPQAAWSVRLCRPRAR